MSAHTPAGLRGLDGPLTQPHRKALATRREEHPISRLQHLRDPDGYTHRCSGATVEDSHKGPQNNQGKPAYNPQKMQITKQLTHLKHMHDMTATLVAPAARQGGTAERPLSKVSLARGTDAPRIRSALLEGYAPPRAGFASLEASTLPRAGSASPEG
jgi:hypothetical protein